MADEICVGDTVCLFSEDTSGYVFYEQTGFSSEADRVVVYKEQNQTRPSVPDPQVLEFQICTRNQYELSKEYHKIKAELEKLEAELKRLTTVDKDKSYQLMKAKLEKALLAAEKEAENNQTRQHLNDGRRLLFGDVIQIKHVQTKQYVHISSTETSTTESKNMKVFLSDHNAKQAWFKVMPFHDSEAIGHEVKETNSVLFESLKRPGHYLHVGGVTSSSPEINLSTTVSAFQMFRRHKYVRHAEPTTGVKSGSVIRLFNEQLKAYLEVEGLKQVYLRQRPDDRQHPLRPPTSATTYWQIENHENIIRDDSLRWNEPCHIRHLITRQYLKVTKKGKVTLTSNIDDPSIVFCLQAKHQGSDLVSYWTPFRMDHVQTKSWLLGSMEDYQPSDSSQKPSTNLPGTKASLKEVTSTKSDKSSTTFRLQEVKQEQLEDFNCIVGLVSTIHTLLADIEAKHEVREEQMVQFTKSLEKLKALLVIDGVPGKKIQKLLRDLMVIDMLVKLLPARLPYPRNTTGKRNITPVDVLLAFIKGKSMKNRIYLGTYFDDIVKYLNVNDDPEAEKIFIEILQSNRWTVFGITHEQIDQLVKLFQRHKRYQYFDILGHLCVCNDVVIPDNQNHITEVLLESSSSVRRFELGRNIGLDQCVLYTSTENGGWMPLCNQPEDIIVFCAHQLNLFSKLCQDNNKTVIGMIKGDSGYLTWDVALECLEDERISNTLKTSICQLIPDLFLEVGRGRIIQHQIHTTIADRSLINLQNDTEDLSELDNIDVLKSWISKRQEWRITDLGIDDCKLLKQTLRLVCSMLTFGYYNTKEDIDVLKDSTVKLLTEIHFESKKAIDRQTDDIDSSLSEQILDIKHECLQILDNIHQSKLKYIRETVVQMFMDTYSRRQTFQFPELDQLLEGNFKASRSERVSIDVTDWLNKIFDENGLSSNYLLTEEIINASHCTEDKLLTKVLILLSKYHSPYDSFCKTVDQIQILISDKSVAVFSDVLRKLTRMVELSTYRMTSEQTKELIHLLKQLEMHCHVENSTDKRHPVNQDIFYRIGVLSAVFDMFSRLKDELSTDDEEVLQEAFKLLKALAKDHKGTQQYLLDRLDFLLKIEGAQNEMADALIEVFAGNVANCYKVLPYQIEKIMEIVASQTKKVPRMVDLLSAMLQVNENNEPVSKIEKYVMKSFILFQDRVDYVLKPEFENRQELLMGNDCPDLTYMIALMNLLSKCAEGGNRFVLSVCQTVISIDDLLNTLTDPSVHDKVKMLFLRFFLKVYINEKDANKAKKLSCHKQLWEYFGSLIDTLQSLTDLVRNENNDDWVPLEDPAQSGDSDREHFSQNEKLHGVLDVVTPFISTFFQSVYDPDIFADSEQDVNKLAEQFLDFTLTIAPTLRNSALREDVFKCTFQILSASSLPFQKTQQLLEEHKQWANLTEEKPSVEDDYDSYYSKEIKYNRRLRTFITNMIAAYKRYNVETSKHDDCVALDKDIELPSGKEFNELVKWFMKEEDTTAENKYQLAGVLLEQLRISSQLHHTYEKDQVNQEELDVMCLQILRAFVQNEISKLPANWKDKSLLTNRKIISQLKAVRNAQDVLNKHECASKVLPHLSKASSEIVIKEVLAFLTVMLFNNNESTQGSITEYITQDDTFIDSLQTRMLHTIIVTKKRCSFIAKQQAITEQMKRQREIIEAHKYTRSTSDVGNPDGSNLWKRMGRGFGPKRNVVHPYTNNQELNQLPPETKDKDSTELLISVLGLMCEGQNTRIQDILRVQPGEKSSNLIAETSNLLGVIYKNLYPETIKLAIKLFYTLSHFCSGNYENVIVVAENNICGYINCILMTEHFQDCSPEDITELKTSIARLIVTLLHEITVGRQMDGSTHASLTEVVRGLDADSILQEAVVIYEKIKNEGRTSSNLQLERNLGFNYFFILKHLCDMKQSPISQTELLKSPLHQEVWRFYETRTKSIEIVERNATQKVYFSYSQKIEIDEYMKESLLYEVDRSYDSKLSYFTQWSKDVLDMMKHEHRAWIWQNYVWRSLNVMMIILTIIQVVYIGETYNERYEYKIGIGSYDIFPFALLHNINTLAVFVVYLTRKRFTFPSLKTLRPENLYFMMVGRRNEAQDGEKKRRSKLEVPIFCFKTFWYLMLLVFSILGTLHFGLYFAFHLLHVAKYNRRFRNNARFFTGRGFWSTLMFNVLFFFICLYICSLVTFVAFRDMYSDVQPTCNTVYNCFLTVFLNAATLFDQDCPSSSSNCLPYKIWKALLIALAVIGFGFLFCFLIEACTQYRQKERLRINDVHNTCFICGLSRNDTKRSGTNFDRHVKEEHCLQTYVNYFVYLAEINKQFYTPVDYYVSRMFQKGSPEFLPLHRATSLQEEK